MQRRDKSSLKIQRDGPVVSRLSNTHQNRTLVHTYPHTFFIIRQRSFPYTSPELHPNALLTLLCLHYEMDEYRA